MIKNAAKPDKTAVNILMGLLIAVCIITTAVTVTLNFRPLYYLDIKTMNISEESGYPEDEIKQNYDVLIDYNNVFYQGELDFPTMPMSDNARTHFAEVKRVFSYFEYACFITLPAAAVLIFIMARRKEYGYLLTSAVCTVAVPAVLGVMIAINWEAFFVGMHKMIFNNDYWLFDPGTDPVITILPDGFFMHCAVMILALVIAGSVVCFLFWNRFGRQKKS